MPEPTTTATATTTTRRASEHGQHFLLHLIIAVGLALVLTTIMYFTGLIISFGAWFFSFTLLIWAPITAHYLHNQMGMGKFTAGIFIAVPYTILVLAVWSGAMEIMFNIAPRTTEANIVRAADTDIRTSDATRPYGTGLRNLYAHHRQQREDEINESARLALEEVRKAIGTKSCLDTKNAQVLCTQAWAQAEEQKIAQKANADVLALPKVTFMDEAVVQSESDKAKQPAPVASTPSWSFPFTSLMYPSLTQLGIALVLIFGLYLLIRPKSAPHA